MSTSQLTPGAPPPASVRIGADVGGTFTDLVLVDGEGRIHAHKLPSTPPHFEKAVLDGLDVLLRQRGVSGSTVSEVTHGTTVATNAVLERRGAVTALITTRGFRDVAELRRIRAPQMYNLFLEKPRPLVERYLRFELAERVAADGQVLLPVDEGELHTLLQHLERERVESVAVCLLHSYAHPRHEKLLGDFFRKNAPGLQVSLSCEVLRERKEYERTATTIVNAYVRPVMQRYLEAMRMGLGTLGVRSPLLIMQSGGGLTPESDAAARPVFVLESGPAAGVLAAAYTAGRLGLKNVITLDVGGTTAKASMIEEGQVAYSSESEVGSSMSSTSRLVGGGGERIRAPSIDIAEVGSGGGSIAYLDRAGGLRVGPRSAGALPGPACYQRGGKDPTVTDANVVLGYLFPGKLANGDVTVDLTAAERAIFDHIAKPLGMGLLEAAEGIHRIANARTMRALRAVSTERGRDPRNFVLMSFGGSGPIHTAGLARELRVSQTLVPPLPGLFSALGLLFCGVEHHDVRSCLFSGSALQSEALDRIRRDMLESMSAQFQEEGFFNDPKTWSWSVDARFRGQASEIRISLSSSPMTEGTLRALQNSFEQEHERLYGHRSDPDNPMEIVAVRLVGRVSAPPQEDIIPPAERLQRTEKTRKAYFGLAWGAVDAPVLSRRELSGSQRGPLLIDEYDSTTVVPPDQCVRCDERGNLLISSL